MSLRRNFRLNRWAKVVGIMFCLTLTSSPLEVVAETYFLQAGGPPFTATVADSDTARFAVLGGRSYCAEIRTVTFSNPLATFNNNGASLFGTSSLELETTVLGESYPRLTSTFFANDENSRLCFEVSGTETNQAAVISLDIETSDGGVAPQTVLRVVETTLFGGYNTSVTDFNFLELTNTGSLTTGFNGIISGTVTARSALTDTVLLTQDFMVSPGDRVDINIHDAVGPNSFGVITVSHNGGPGLLKGVVSQYRIVSVSPLDFEPVLQQQLTNPNPN